MNLEPHPGRQPFHIWADGLDGQEDELEEAEREAKEEKKDGDEEPDYDLELQKRLNKH